MSISSKLVWWVLAAIFVFHVFASWYSWYWIYSWIDIPMHFIGGVWVGMFFIWIFQGEKSNYFSPLPNILHLFVLSGFVILIGVFWEFFEFSFDFFIAKKGLADFAQQGTADTLGDLAMDLFGGITSWLVWSGRSKISDPHP